MTNVIHTFTKRRQESLAQSAAAAWEEICGDYDPSRMGDGNFDASMRRETSAETAASLAVAALVQLDPAQHLPHIPYRNYWDVEDLPENAEVIFPKGVWEAQA